MSNRHAETLQGSNSRKRKFKDSIPGAHDKDALSFSPHQTVTIATSPPRSASDDDDTVELDFKHGSVLFHAKRHKTSLPIIPSQTPATLAQGESAESASSRESFENVLLDEENSQYFTAKDPSERPASLVQENVTTTTLPRSSYNPGMDIDLTSRPQLATLQSPTAQTTLQSSVLQDPLQLQTSQASQNIYTENPPISPVACQLTRASLCSPPYYTLSPGECELTQTALWNDHINQSTCRTDSSGETGLVSHPSSTLKDDNELVKVDCVRSDKHLNYETIRSDNLVKDETLGYDRHVQRETMRLSESENEVSEPKVKLSEREKVSEQMSKQKEHGSTKDSSRGLGLGTLVPRSVVLGQKKTKKGPRNVSVAKIASCGEKLDSVKGDSTVEKEKDSVSVATDDSSSRHGRDDISRHREKTAETEYHRVETMSTIGRRTVKLKDRHRKENESGCRKSVTTVEEVVAKTGFPAGNNEPCVILGHVSRDESPGCIKELHKVKDKRRKEHISDCRKTLTSEEGIEDGTGLFEAGIGLPGLPEINSPDRFLDQFGVKASTNRLSEENNPIRVRGHDRFEAMGLLEEENDPCTSFSPVGMDIAPGSMTKHTVHGNGGRNREEGMDVGIEGGGKGMRIEEGDTKEMEGIVYSSSHSKESHHPMERDEEGMDVRVEEGINQKKIEEGGEEEMEGVVSSTSHSGDYSELQDSGLSAIDIFPTDEEFGVETIRRRRALLGADKGGRDSLLKEATRKLSLKAKKRKRKSTDGSILGALDDGSDKQKRVAPNYFVAIQVSNPEIHKALQDVQQTVMAGDEKLKDAMVPISTLHLTIMVMHLANDEDIERAKLALMECHHLLGPQLCDRKMNIWFHGLGHFNNQVMFAKIKDVDGIIDKLYNIAETVENCYRRHGIHSTGERGFKPHLTVMKLSRAPSLRKKGVRRIKSELYRAHSAMLFGGQEVGGFQLCSINKPKSEEGYYYKAHEIRFGEAPPLMADLGRFSTIDVAPKEPITELDTSSASISMNEASKQPMTELDTSAISISIDEAPKEPITELDTSAISISIEEEPKEPITELESSGTGQSEGESSNQQQEAPIDEAPKEPITELNTSVTGQPDVEPANQQLESQEAKDTNANTSPESSHASADSNNEGSRSTDVEPT